ncbi:hypothetical protein [Streptomyces tritici]|uniref:hypothetical protein n=1 Tax=Streptomyces tritici TaxID=2054410 RepID=UPI003AF02F38
MYEGSLPLEDFLDTMDRLQADFERRLKGIEHKASLKQSRMQKRSTSPAAGPHESSRRPLGIEAIWTTARRTPTTAAESPWEETFTSSRRPDPAPADATERLHA